MSPAFLGRVAWMEKLKMGKIVKFCSSCDEGFAEKFGFCPNCGQTLQAFEMNRVDTNTAPSQPVATQAMPDPTPEVVEAQPVIEAAPVPAAVETVMDPEPEPEPELVANTIPVPAPVYTQPVAVNADTVRSGSDGWVNVSSGDDDGAFRVTVIEEKNVGTRRGLLAGSLALMLLLLSSATVYSIFNKDLGVGSISEDYSLASLIDEVPTVVEEAPKPKLDKKDAGGGGGGGREEQEETTQGDLADQTPKPVRAPDAKVFRSDTFDLKMPPPSTEGDRKFEKKFDRWGDPNGRFASFSNGTGSGGGQGTGTGTGQGSGRGTGAGSGTGSGSGGGLGSGNGNGTGIGGRGGDDEGPPPPVKPVGVTQGLKILSKPRPGYTDAARTANIQGTVILRVTFLANGQVGSISPVKGLPNGLTEQAIAAARRIAFEPAKTNGQGQTVTKQIEYSFSIY
jgi:protein TonB